MSKVSSPIPISPRSSGTYPLTTREICFRHIAPGTICLIALFVGWFITADLDPFTTTIVLSAFAMFVIGLCNPAAGVYLLIFASGYLDLVKRLGVLTDALSVDHVVLTLTVAPLLSVFICLGVVYHCIMKRSWLNRWQLVLAALVGAAMVGIFLQVYFRGGSALLALKEFAETGAYLPLTVVVCLLFPNAAEVRRLITFCLWVYTPVALYGIWQQFFGFSDFEVDYFKSGFTSVAVSVADARPFSTLNSPEALGVVTAVLSAVAALVPLKNGKYTKWQPFVSLLFGAACFATFARSAWIILPLAVLVWMCCRTKLGAIALYGAAVVGFGALLLNADPLLRSLDQIDSLLPQDNGVEAQAFHLGTFSERLMSFRNVLTNPEFHTWFGTGAQDYQDSLEQSYDNVVHEQIGQTLVSFGFVGLSFFLTVFVFGLITAHWAIFNQCDPARRGMMLGCLSALVAILFSGMIFGSHLGVFPINVFFALLAGCFCSLSMSKASP